MLSKFDDPRVRREVFNTACIEAVVRDFYGVVQADAKLAPVFSARVEDWEPHLQRMMTFWRSILRGEGSFHASARGAPPALHAALHEADATHFERWLELFEAVLLRHLATDAAAYWKLRASRMAQTLSRHLETPYRIPERGTFAASARTPFVER